MLSVDTRIAVEMPRKLLKAECVGLLIFRIVVYFISLSYDYRLDVCRVTKPGKYGNVSTDRIHFQDIDIVLL